jgi:hypothetical protein
MTEVKRTINVPATTRVIVDHITCELCGTPSASSNSWTNKTHDIKETLIEYKSGYNAPLGYNIDVVTLDICPACFTSELIPWFQSRGGKIRTQNSQDC